MGKRDKIFDVCFVFMTELVSDARTLNFARTLVRNGKSVCIIATGTDEEALELSKEKITFFPVKPVGAERFRTKWLHFLKSARKYRSRARAKIFVASDLYIFYVARQLSRLHNAKIIYDSREIYSALGPLSKNPVKQMIISGMERRLIHQANDIIVSGQKDAEYLYKLYNLKHLPKVIMNLPPFRPVAKTNLLGETYNIGADKNILIYQGMLLPGRGLLPIVRSLVFYEDAVFCIMGDGPLKDQIVEHARSLNVESRVILCGRVPYDELHDWTCSADTGIAFIEPVSFSYELALPNKLFEYCMAEIPSLVSDLPAMREVIEKHPIGRLLPADASPETIAHTLKDIHANRQKYIRACRESAMGFSYESQEKLIMDLVKKYL